MAKEKLAIVSSYDEACGNASYTKALVDGLSKHYDVTVIPLKVDLLRKNERSAAESHIRTICEQLRAFDCVNIQFEAGLFGSKLSLILKRFRAIARASKKLIVTMHRFHAKEKYPGFKVMVRSLIRGDLKARWLEIQFAYANYRLIPHNTIKIDRAVQTTSLLTI